MSKPMGTVKHYCSNEHCKKGMKEHLSLEKEIKQ